MNGPFEDAQMVHSHSQSRVHMSCEPEKAHLNAKIPYGPNQMVHNVHLVSYVNTIEQCNKAREKVCIGYFPLTFKAFKSATIRYHV